MNLLSVPLNAGKSDLFTARFLNSAMLPFGIRGYI